MGTAPRGGGDLFLWYWVIDCWLERTKVYSNVLTFQTGEKERFEIVLVDERPGAVQGAARERPGAAQGAAREQLGAAQGAASDQELEEEEVEK
jgi:hypothetical protein